MDSLLVQYPYLEELLKGILGLSYTHVIMWLIGGLLIFLAVKYDYEPALLLPIGFGAILANIPHSSAVSTEPGAEGFLITLYNAGIANELFPVLIFIAIGAMCDFAPLIRRPSVMLFAAAAQFGIFATAIGATFLGFSFPHASSIGIIGAADGPTTIYVASRYAVELLGPLSVAAYCYMSLVPVIQPPVIKAVTTQNERKIRMGFENEEPVSDTTKFLFPIMIVIVAGVVSPLSVALIGALMFGNVLKESGVVDNLSNCAQNELSNLVTLVLGITIGGTMTAERFLNFQVLLIMALGAVAFVFDTVGGVLFAKILNMFSAKKINPMIGACGISAFPMSSRVVQKLAMEEEKGNIILMHAVGANVSGQIASVIAGGLVIKLVSQYL